jgi:hypothetical protein
MASDMKPVRGRRTADSVVRYHIERQRQSGKSVYAYCREQRFSPWTFHLWRKRMAAVQELSREQPRLSFVELPVSRAVSREYELRLGDGVVLRFGSSCSPALVGQLAAALRSGTRDR